MNGLLIVLFAAGCGTASTVETDHTDEPVDVDGDGHVADEDCNEADGVVYVGAPELCDGIDNDCDDVIDDDATDATVFYVDLDQDGYGDPGSLVTACAAPDGYVDVAGDCDDGDAAWNPGAAEADCADPNDYNCDGSVAFEDGDGDRSAACEDCDDDDPDVFPGAVELCNDTDDDCDGTVDQDATDATSWFQDDDADGYGTDTTVAACLQPDGYARYAGDCDDTNNDYHPNASETDCTDPNDYNCDGSVGFADADGDGFPACEECDDSEATHNPDATEFCDGFDDDCDGTVDEPDAADASTWYSDADGDGFGDLDTPQIACDLPVDYVLDAADCDDSDDAEYPGADEVCDGDDDDCDGEVDEASAIDASTWYADADTDGYGDVATSAIACYQPDGYIADDTDCDDTDEAEHPGADERCDGDDDDCDGEVDEPSAIDAGTWYADADSDGYGDASNSEIACDAPPAYVADDTDCDDFDNDVNPTALEACNGIDDNCDGDVDEATSADALTWYADGDGDAYGDAAVVQVACEAPTGYSALDTDCDDGDANEYPGADEYCDGDDDDCDGEIDEDAAVDVVTWYRDADADGYGELATTDVDCDIPSGFVAGATDCDDTTDAVNPGEIEVCDAASVDEDCSGAADDFDAGAVGETSWYADADADGYGNVADTLSRCDQPTDYVADATDCDDTDDSDYPGATETTGNGDDEDCDGGEVCWTDADSDGYRLIGTTSVVSTDADCADAGEGSNAEPATDCDDTDATEFPGASEYCDGDDDDCDSLVDEDGAIDVVTWYADADADGYGDLATTDVDCDQPSGYVADDTDCDDGDGGVNPGAPEVCDGANTDEDCDGAVDDDDSGATGQTAWYADADLDGYGDEFAMNMACDAPVGYVVDDTDCDDADAAINPAASEMCDAASVDEDCNSLADDDDGGATGQTSWWEDADTDDYGSEVLGVSACDEPAGYLVDNTDCDDTDGTVNPGATEVVANGVDNDCDGGETCYDDDDDDGMLDAGGDTRASADGDCSDANEALSTASTDDCDDTDDTVYLGATELCDSLDNDCDGVVDDGATSTWYADADSDTYGDVAVTTSACTAPSGYVADDTDCDDTDDTVFPGAAAVCEDFVVNDCDATSDECALSGVALVTAHDRAYWYGVNLFSATAGDNVGITVEGVGDVDGDGLDDIGFGANAYDPTTAMSNAGRAWVYRGGATSGAVQLTAAELGYVTVTGTSGTTNPDNLGYQVSAGGNFTGASSVDLVVGSYNTRYTGISPGDAMVFATPVGSLTRTSATLVIQSVASSDNMGFDVSGGQDVDGDGRADIVAGAYQYDGGSLSNSGGAVYFPGGTTGTHSITSTSGELFYGSAISDQAGQIVALIPDVSGDGIGELVIGAYKAEASATYLEQGEVYVIYGETTLVGGNLSSAADVTLVGPSLTSAEFGRSMDGAGDVDGDGSDDLIIGTHQDTVGAYTTAGSASVYLSSGTGIPTTSSIELEGSFTGDVFGRAVAGGGDFNGDGSADIAVGGTSYDTTTFSGAGAVALWYGPVASGTYNVSAADFLVTGTTASEAMGSSVAFLGDTDGDGFDDLGIGATNWDSSTTSNVGAVFLLLGTGD